MMYSLRHDKEKMELTIEKWNFNKTTNLREGEFKYWNDNIFIATNRKILRKLAEEIKQKWLKETEHRLEKINLIKVKTKY